MGEKVARVHTPIWGVACGVTSSVARGGNCVDLVPQRHIFGGGGKVARVHTPFWVGARKVTSLWQGVAIVLTLYRNGTYFGWSRQSGVCAHAGLGWHL